MLPGKHVYIRFKAGSEACKGNISVREWLLGKYWYSGDSDLTMTREQKTKPEEDQTAINGIDDSHIKFFIYGFLVFRHQTYFIKPELLLMS